MLDNLDISNRPICFIIMPFHDPFNDYYDKIIKLAAQAAGFNAERADEILGPGSFMQDVVNGILSSKAIVAELTGKNPNVFYELGLAHALRKPVIMLTQNPDDVPSDLRSLKWIRYATIDVDWATKLKEALTNALKAMLKGDDKKLLFPFVSPALEPAGFPNLLRALGGISGTQKELFNFVRDSKRPINQREVMKRFSFIPSSEVFYRLECLRLMGFLTAIETERDSSGKQVYAYDLSDQARETLK